MKRFLFIPALLIFSSVLAGHSDFNIRIPEYKFSTGEQGYYTSPIYFGGNLGFYPYKEGFTANISPILGARITRRFHLGLSAGIQYNRETFPVTIHSQKEVEYTYQAAYYDASVFARYFMFWRFFAHVEPGMVNLKQLNELHYDFNSDQIIENSTRLSIPNLLGGLGYAQPIGGQSILVLTVLYDFYQHENSPYGNYPFLRGGFNLGF